jgi:hypothetical protein
VGVKISTCFVLSKIRIVGNMKFYILWVKFFSSNSSTGTGFEK